MGDKEGQYKEEIARLRQSEAMLAVQVRHV